MRTRFRSES